MDLSRATIIYVDMETYWADDYTLSKMPTQLYILDPRFKAHGACFAINDGPIKWVSHDKLPAFLAALHAKYPYAIWVAHNALFDMMILSEIYGIHPKLVIDTAGMSRALIGPLLRSHSLDNLSELLLGRKKPYGELAKSKNIRELPPDIERSIAQYCAGDVDLMREDLRIMAPCFPACELPVMTWVTRMMTRPLVHLDQDMLWDYHLEIVRRKENILEDLGIDRDVLMSNDKFAQLLVDRGVEPPLKQTKPSVRYPNGRMTWAFAKTDPGLKELLEHDDPDIQALVAARLEVKSTIEETRSKTYATLANCNPVGIPLAYSGAIPTHRLSGRDKLNFQNLKRNGVIRNCIVAPPGYVFVVSDLGQIEFRITLCLAGHLDVVQRMALGADLYSEFGTLLYGYEVSKATKHERQVSKSAVLGCIAEGQKVLTDKGLIPIEQITLAHRLWDGVEWVHHSGLVFRGEKEVIEYDGLIATPDHEVYIQGSGWQRFDATAERGDRIACTGNGRAALRLVENSIDRNTTPYKKSAETLLRMYQLCAANISLGKQRLANTWNVRKMSFLPEKNNARRVAKESRNFGQTIRCYYSAMHQSATSLVSPVWRAWGTITFSIAQGIYSLRNSRVATRIIYWCRNRSYRQQWALCAGEFAPSFSRDQLQQQRKHEILHTQRQKNSLRFGVSYSKSIRPDGNVHSRSGKKLETERGNYDTTNYRSLPQSPVRQTKRTYDIANAGPRNRFTVSDRLVHNCGFGMGHARYKLYCAAAGIKIDTETAKRAIDLFRMMYRLVPKLWELLENCFAELLRSNTPFDYKLGSYNCHFGFEPLFGSPGIRLPNGLWIKYPQLRLDEDGQWWYADSGAWRKIWGGHFLENLAQALARIVIMEKSVKIDKFYPVVMSTHDEIAALVRDEVMFDEESNEIYMPNYAKEEIGQIMTENVPWFPGLALNTETEVGYRYGEAK